MKTWWQRIDESEKRGCFTVEEEDLAGDWVTCACGTQDKRIPRYLEGEPHDPQLQQMGKNFMASVCDRDFQKARATLQAIEKRAGEILAQMEAG